MNTNQAALSDITIIDLCDEKGQLIGKLLGEMGGAGHQGGAAGRGQGANGRAVSW